MDKRIFRPVSSAREIDVDVMVIASTNRDLESLLEKRRFREDLYHRLNVVRIEMPPLRERGDDVLLLARHFLKGLARKFEKGPITLGEEGERVLREYEWPGNVRELKNVLERAVLLGRGETLEPGDRESRKPALPGSVIHPAGETVSVALPEGGISFAPLATRS